jgi:hypothetical protein
MAENTRDNKKTKRKSVKERLEINLKRAVRNDLSSESEELEDDEDKLSAAGTPRHSKVGSSTKLRSSTTGVMQQKLRGSFSNNSKNLEVPADKRASFKRRSGSGNKKKGSPSKKSGGDLNNQAEN